MFVYDEKLKPILTKRAPSLHEVFRQSATTRMAVRTVRSFHGLVQKVFYASNYPITSFFLIETPFCQRPTVEHGSEVISKISFPTEVLKNLNGLKC